MDYSEKLNKILGEPGPVIVRLFWIRSGFEPRISSKQLPDGKIITVPLEDMYPFLDREELEKYASNSDFFKIT